MKPYQAVAHLNDGRYAVLSIDPTKPEGDGCKAVIQSIHATEREARSSLDGEHHERTGNDG
jgi:hypothetical protein